MAIIDGNDAADIRHQAQHHDNSSEPVERLTSRFAWP
jgi:hypothetical protein